MDASIQLTPDEIKGRNLWILWCAGNEAFWDHLATESAGLFDLLKTLDSRRRSNRLQEFGLINQPGFKQATKPDENGLWLDAGQELDGLDTKVFGRSSGVMGFRLFDNPEFKGEAVAKWRAQIDQATGEARAVYARDGMAGSDRLVRPYRVGVSCGACHVSYHPGLAPKDANEPEYRNLASAAGNQYLKEGAVFAPNARTGSFLKEMLDVQPRGTSDTSRIATDHINNPSAINAIVMLAEREQLAQPEKIVTRTTDGKTKRARQKVPRILKDGADSIGLAGAVMRVYVNTGMDHERWLRMHQPLVGLKPQHPYKVEEARATSAWWQVTEASVPYLAAFFRKLPPFRLADAEEEGVRVGGRYLNASAEVMQRGMQVFAKACAQCHSSKRPPADVSRDEWFAREISKPGFAENNFFSDERRYPVTRIQTNAARACATNAMAGQIWDRFSSKTYKDLDDVGDIEVWSPYTGKDEEFAIKGGGRGYYRTPPLAGLWATAPFFHNNSLGEESMDPSVAGRMKAFEDAAQKLLWPEKRKGKEGIWRTARESTLRIPAAMLPDPVRTLLAAGGHLDAGGSYELGPIPAGTPVNLLANINPKADPKDLAELLIHVKQTLAVLKQGGLDEAGRHDLMRKQIAPALWKVSKCPDLIPDRGHTFGSRLPDSDKHALIAYLRTL